MFDRIRSRRVYQFSMLPEALIVDSSVSDRAVRLWALLDRVCWRDDAQMPTRSQLALSLGCSPKSVDRAVSELIQAGWLEIESGRFSGAASSYIVTDEPALDSQRGWTPVSNPVGHGCPTPWTPVSNPPGPDLRKHGTENKRSREVPPTPQSSALGEPCARHKHLGRLHSRCRACGTAGRPPAPTPTPPPLAEVFSIEICEEHGGRVGSCPSCRRKEAQ